MVQLYLRIYALNAKSTLTNGGPECSIAYIKWSPGELRAEPSQHDVRKPHQFRNIVGPV